MYGEKVEETEELRLDLQDIKDMYKTQVSFTIAVHIYMLKPFLAICFRSAPSTGHFLESLVI